MYGLNFYDFYILRVSLKAKVLTCRPEAESWKIEGNLVTRLSRGRGGKLS